MNESLYDEFSKHQKALDEIREKIKKKQRDRMRPRFFIDKECESNLEHGLPYYAVGIIVKDNTKEGICLKNGGFGAYCPPTNGKDFLVSFITPWGEVETEYRSIDQIRIIETTWDKYERMQCAQKSIYNECPYK